MSRTVVVTGSASGLGKATKELLAHRGNEVIGVDLAGADVCADLSTRDGCAAMAREVEKLSGGMIDAVIANAGSIQDRCALVNYFGVIDTLELLQPILLRSSAPRAAVTCSIAGAFADDPAFVEALENGDRDAGAEQSRTHQYMVSKLAIARWVRKASADWARKGILLNAVGPGVVPTPLFLASEQNDPAGFIAAAPLGRTADPKEIAEVFAFLISPENSFMTGQIIYVDGGMEAGRRPHVI